MNADREILDWKLIWHGYRPGRRGLEEALNTLGNGYFATRGAFEDCHADGRHYPGTYLAGGYDRQATLVADRMVENEDLVNWPNWLPLTFRIEGGSWVSIDHVEVLQLEQTLELDTGVLIRHLRMRDDEGRETELESRRFVSMRNRHVAGIHWKITPLNWSGEITVRSSIDGTVKNAGVPRYRALEGHHHDVERIEQVGEDSMLLQVRARQSRVVVAVGARTRVFPPHVIDGIERTTQIRDGVIEQDLQTRAEAHVSIEVEKMVTLFTSRDRAISEPTEAAAERLEELPSFAKLLDEHQEAWKRLWSRFDVKLHPRSQYEQGVLRLHIFHLLQTTSEHTVDLDVGVPARGLHGEAYRGHIFWDELFIFPTLVLSAPEIARSLLMYRYRRLKAARRAAARSGLRGAMFPWQSGSDGREESQTVHLNPKSGRWLEDHTYRQRHISAAIAYNVLLYYQCTVDFDFMAFYGAELLIEISRFWASLADYDADEDRYHIKGVVGPDEFHTLHPRTGEPGIDDNAYTNLMAVWCLCRTCTALESLDSLTRKDLLERLDVTPEERWRWEHISRRMYLPLREDGLLLQFADYDTLQELDWEGLTARHADIARLDRVLEAEGNDVNRYQASKQADVLMLLYLFSVEQLEELFHRLGYPFEPAWVPRWVDYYEARTSNGSTLSQVVHAWVMARSQRATSWPLFRQALRADIEDVQGGTTPEGIHLGAMAGTVDLVQRGYTGLEPREDVLRIKPRLPQDLDRICFSIRYRDHWLRFEVGRKRVQVECVSGGGPPIRVGCRGVVRKLDVGQSTSFAVRGVRVDE